MCRAGACGRVPFHRTPRRSYSGRKGKATAQLATAWLMGGTVPLSEHEQRQLEQIEQALYAEHPRLARAMRSKDPKVHYRRRVIQAAVGFLLGAGMLVAGILLKYVWLEAAGVAVMLFNGIVAVVSYRRMAGILTDRKRRKDRKAAAKAAANSGLMERLEERWRRRQEGNNR
jgi:heme exporter protein D